MSSLSPNATNDEIEEELVFLEVLKESLDLDAHDYAEKLAECQASIADLESRLADPQAGTAVHSRTAQPENHMEQIPDIDGSHDQGEPFWQTALNGRPGNNGSQRSLNDPRPGTNSVDADMNSMQSNGMKRRAPDHLQPSSLHPSKRPTPEPSNAGTPTSFDESFEWLENTGFESRDRSVRHQMAAEAAFKRQMEDQRFARTLSAAPKTASSFASSSRPSFQTTLNYNGSYQKPPQRPQPATQSQNGNIMPVQYPQLPSQAQSSMGQPGPSIKREPGMPIHHQQLPQRSKAPEVVDLTNSDDEELTEIAPNGFTPNRRAPNTSGHQNGVPRPHLPMPPMHPQPPSQPMPGAYPMPNSNGYQSVYGPGPAGAQQRYPWTQPQQQQQPNPLLNGAIHAVSGIRNMTGMLGNTWNELGNLVNGTSRQPWNMDEDDDSDDLIYGGSRRVAGGPTAFAGYDDMNLYQTRHDAIANYDPSKTTEEINALLENIRPDEDMPAHLRVETPEAMAIKLHKYQELGLTWLQKCEDGSNSGGILADDMGLGKTIQMLSLIVTHKPEDPRVKTTLIIAPVALMRQWRQEIEQKVKPGRHRLSVFVHHGPSKKKKFQDLSHYDVVLTTYGSLASELGKMESFAMRRKYDPDARPSRSEQCALISEDAHWHRVILDEAQCIKNSNTKTARAACYLKSQYRWAMTGTPMMNNVAELHSLIKFLRIKPYSDWTKFRLDFVTPLKSSGDEGRERAMRKLQTLVKAILLRRTKYSKFEGQPILVLPERTTGVENPEFSTDEQEFYTALENKTQLQFNKYLRNGTVGSSYSAILVLLLRLRQACCHPHLIKDFGVSAAAGVPPETLIELAKQLDPPVIERIRETGGNFECNICYDAVTNPAIFLPCGHDTCSECFARIADNAARDGNENAQGKPKCPNCRGEVDPKRITDFDSFKRVHMRELLTDEEKQESAELETAKDNGSDDDSDSDSDDDSDDEDQIDAKGNLKDFIVNDDEEEEVEDVETDSQAEEVNGEEANAVAGPSKKSKGRKKGKKGKGKGKKGKKKAKNATTLADLKKLATRSKKAHTKYMARLRKDWITSAKIEKTLDKLREIMNDPEGEKVLVFSQWTSLLDILEVPIDGAQWGYRRYDGSMNAKARGDAVDDFRDRNKNIRIMLVSLKAGNAGLNLNEASHVIILDPFWNPYIEEQAIDRAHRLGQTRPVKVHRILVEGTVEDRIIALQEKKRALISEALDEKAGQSIARLDVHQLAYLFGVTRNASDRVNYVPRERRR